MDKEYMTRLIYEYNEHREKGIATPPFKRHLYHELKKWMGKKQILAITGLRRTGKTTIMKQLMNELGKGSAFFSFDEEETQTKEALVFILDFMLNNFKPKYIFLDEVHYVKDWQGVLKRYYDTKNVKLIISGSESIEIRKARESLAGRITTFKLGTLSFKEYLELKGKNTIKDKIPINNITLKKLENIYNKLLPEKEYYEKEFKEYLYKGAFPELVNEKDESIIRKYVNDLVVRKIIYRDLPAVFEIKRRKLLFELFRYACSNTANLYEIRNLSMILNADYETISNYTLYLESAFLIKTSETYSKSISKRIRRNKKIHVAHPTLAFAVLGYEKNMLVEKILGQYVETLFARKLFWRDKHKNEVDTIIKKQETLIPLEVKYKTGLTNKDTKGLLRFTKKFKIKKGILITKDTLKEQKIQDKNILYIPAWLYLLTIEEENTNKPPKNLLHTLLNK